jgi:hypothetical protein
MTIAWSLPTRTVGDCGARPRRLGHDPRRRPADTAAEMDKVLHFTLGQDWLTLPSPRWRRRSKATRTTKSAAISSAPPPHRRERRRLPARPKPFYNNEQVAAVASILVLWA